VVRGVLDPTPWQRIISAYVPGQLSNKALQGKNKYLDSATISLDPLKISRIS